MWKCVGQRVEAPSWIGKKQRPSETTEQETSDNSQGPGVSVGATSRWISSGPWDSAQSECTNTGRWLAGKVKGKVTAECPESEGKNRFGLDALLSQVQRQSSLTPGV